MLKNFLRIAWRNLIRKKGYSAINILGLAVGMACCLLILMWVEDEMSYDRFHKQSDDIYRVVTELRYGERSTNLATTPAPLAPMLKQEIPDIMEYCRYYQYDGSLIQFTDKAFFERQIHFADPSFFKIFTFSPVEGNIESSLEDKRSIVITESIAQKYFGDGNALGQVLSIKGLGDFSVSAVLDEIPSNSHFQFDFILPFDNLIDLGEPLEGWGRMRYFTYILARENAYPDSLESKIAGFFKEHEIRIPAKLHLQSLRAIHFDSSFGYDFVVHGDRNYIYIFSIIALFVLLIACINFMNISIARASDRAREVGMHKVLGANRWALLRQFIGETLLVTFVSLLLAIVIVELFLPAYNSLVAKKISLFSNGIVHLIAVLLLFTIITGLFAGSYPALFLSSLHPSQVLKGVWQSGKKRTTFRKILVVSQFVISIFLISCTAIITNQLDYMRNKKLGFDKEQIIFVPLRDDTGQRYDALKKDLLHLSGVSRNKEMGIRKVLGASVSDIVFLLLKEFTRWIIIANFIAWPVAYFYMNRWLQAFAFRVNVSLWILLGAGIAALLIALLTVSYQAVRAATINPVDVIKYE